ncbi:hypothetical protein CJ301_16805, partial [Limimaricola cinnabarinus]
PSAPRPPSRPARAAPEPEPAPEPAPVTEPETQTASSRDAEPETPPAADTSDAVADALAAALASTPAPAANPGPPMTGAEQSAFRVAVQECWNVDVGSEAARVTLTVAFDLDPQGRVQGDIRRVGGQGGSEAAIEAAFQSARRAILRCQRDGYVLPAEKYEQWKEVEMTFDPSGMRMR